MIGLDTNVLLRYLTQDDTIQSKIATDFITKYCTDETPGFIGHIVLCELVWVLESNYKQGKNTVILLIQELLQISQLEILDSETVWRALHDFKNSNADFSDHLIGESNLVNGCTQTFTFDKKAGKQPSFKILK